MRPDQIEKLEALAERLADVLIVEADPDNWSGAGKLPNEMTKEERGDRHWDRKGAMGTGGVLRYVADIKQSALERASSDTETQTERESDLDRRIREAEKRAAAAMGRVLSKAKTGAT